MPEPNRDEDCGGLAKLLRFPFGSRKKAKGDNVAAEIEKKPAAVEYPTDFIFFREIVYEIPPEKFDELKYQQAVLHARIEKALESGMLEMDYDGGYGCGWCKYLECNRYQPSKCAYGGDPNIKWATAQIHQKDNRMFMLQKPPCIVNDAAIEILGGWGLLEPYRVSREFNFPTQQEMGELLKAEEKLKQFEVRRDAGSAVYHIARKVVAAVVNQ